MKCTKILQQWGVCIEKLYACLLLMQTVLEIFQIFFFFFLIIDYFFLIDFCHPCDVTLNTKKLFQLHLRTGFAGVKKAVWNFGWTFYQ